MCVQLLHTTIYIQIFFIVFMEKSELDKEITLTRDAIEDLETLQDFGAAQLARNDLAFLLSQLSS